MCVGVDSMECQLVCSEMNEEFSLHLDPLGNGLSDSAIFDSFSAVVSNGFSSNISTLEYLLLQYTASDSTISQVSQATYFSNIAVKDSCCQCCISWELVYHSHQVKSSE